MISRNSSLAIMVLDKGENMYPYLFALFLNDLENFMKNQNSTGLNTIAEDIDTTLGVYHSQKSWVILLMNIHKPNRVMYDVSK